MDKIIHRKARMGYSLCGLEIEPDEVTLSDDQVSCIKCKEILREMTSVDTHTKAIRKFNMRIAPNTPEEEEKAE